MKEYNPDGYRSPYILLENPESSDAEERNGTEEGEYSTELPDDIDEEDYEEEMLLDDDEETDDDNKA